MNANHAAIEAAEQRGYRKALEAARDACLRQQEGFLSPEYATHQPASSIGERLACAACAEAIEELVDETPAEAAEQRALKAEARIAELEAEVAEWKKLAFPGPIAVTASPVTSVMFWENREPTHE